jgi:DNA-binding NarL/FixJ family response regulator
MDLVERDDALGALREAVAQAHRGQGRCVLVHGEAGIGKSSLLKAAFRTPLAAPSPRVLWGGCEALFSPRPLGPLYDMAPALTPSVRALLGQDGQRSELFAALLDELRAGVQPTVLVFEDVHWADAATLDLLKYLARRIEGVAALLVLSYRDDEIGDRHPLRSVLGDLPFNGLVRIALPALSEAGVEQLARRSGATRQGLHAVTRGNPFFVVESLRGEGLPATVRDAVLARAARQAPGVRALLDLVAIVPAHVEVELVQEVLHPSPDDVAAALASGLLLVDVNCLRFRHELARLAIEGALAAPVAAGLHARVLAHLERGGAEGPALARMVHHAAAAGLHDAVLLHAPRAAEWAARHGAHREAAALCQAALDHAHRLDGVARADLLERHAYQCYLVADGHSAVRSRRAALAVWREVGDREREGHNLRWLSRLHWFLGQNTAAESYADEAIATLQPLPPGKELAWALSNRAQMHMLAGRDAAAIEIGSSAIRLGVELGDPEIQAHALNNVGSSLAVDHPHEGCLQIESSLRMALAHGFSEHVARAYVNLVSSAMRHRDYALARRHAAEANQYFATRDLNAWVDYLATLECRIDLERGQWDAATNTAMQLADRRSAMPVSRLPALVVLARLRMRRGDPGVGEALAEATALALATGEPQRLWPVGAAHAEAAWLQRPEADLAFARSAYELAVAQGQARFIGELGFWLRPFGEAGDGDDGPVEPPYEAQRAGRWEQAAALWAERSCPFERALALVASDDEGAIREALAVMEALGARASVQRCRTALRLTGVKGVARGPRASTSAHPAGLTQREAQVLVLMAQGLTNADIASRLFRSAKTVDHHVSAILAKLQARSRAEASAMAAQLGLLDAGAAG